MRVITAAAAAAIAFGGMDGRAETPKGPRPPVDLEAFGRLPTISRVELSPSGARLAAEATTPAGVFLIVRDLAAGRVVARMNLHDMKLRDLGWLDDDRVLLLQSKTDFVPGLMQDRSEWWLASEINLKTGRATNVLDDPPQSSADAQRLNVVTGTPQSIVDQTGDRRLIVFGVSFPTHQGVLTVFSWRGGQTNLVRQGNEDTVDFAVSPKGEIIGRVDYERRSGRWRLFAGASAYDLKLVKAGVDPVGHPAYVGASASGDLLYVSEGDIGEQRYWQVEVKTGAVSPAPDEFQNAGLVVDARTRVVEATVRTGLEGAVYHFLDPRTDAFWRGTVAAFHGAMVEPVSHSADGDLLVVRVLGGEWGYCFALVRRKTGAADVLFDVYEGVAPEDISPKSVIHYKAGDGLDIPAYLTVPRARGPGPLPLVVLPHGGPFARDEPGFDWWAQALASQGYVVLQPQFRGSSGLGLARLQAGYGEYGRKMQTDLSDGVAALAHQGLIDPTRVAIDGGSYGGYAALAGVALQSGVYRCAVSLAGPANVRRQLDHMRERSNGSKETIGSRYWRAFLGVASDADPKLDAVSPDLFAASVQAPVLLIHGLDDTVVPYDQSQRMERALKKAGKEVRFVTLKGEDHWLSRSETRLEMLKATTDFLKSCNPA